MNQRNPWTPGAFSRMPWLPLTAFALCLVGLAASAGILVYSNGKPVEDWKFQPPTILAIATVFTNLCLFYVLKEGATVSWWHTAMKATTVADLHRNYLFGSSFPDAILAGKHINFVALTCIITTIAQINSPLLQRASTVVAGHLPSQIPIRVRLLDSIRFNDFNTGYISGRAYDVSLYTQEFSPVVQDFNTDAKIPAVDSGCKGSCNANVDGLGFHLNCSKYSARFDLNPDVSANGSIEVGSGTSTEGINVFETHFFWNRLSPANFSLGLAYKSSEDCSGDLVVQNCSLSVSKVSYPVVIDGNASTVALDPSTNIFDDRILEPLTYTGRSTTERPDELAGIWLALQNKFASTAHLRFTGAVGYTLTSDGNLATQYAVVNGTRTDGGTASIGSSCNLYFRNPLDEMLAGARDIMFRLSVAAANETTTVTATQRENYPVFKTNYAYMGGALAITVVALLMSAALFHGSSALGRQTTMSPIEIAKAFNAPILSGSDSNAKVKSLIKQVGGRNVMYGVSVTSNDIAPSEYNEGVYGYGANPDVAAKAPFVRSGDFQTSMPGIRKLHMGTTGTVRPPNAREVFDE